MQAEATLVSGKVRQCSRDIRIRRQCFNSSSQVPLAAWRGKKQVARPVGYSRPPAQETTDDIDMVQRDMVKTRYVSGGILMSRSGEQSPRNAAVEPSHAAATRVDVH